MLTSAIDYPIFGISFVQGDFLEVIIKPMNSFILMNRNERQH